MAVESLIPGLEPPVPQRLPSQTESVTSNRTGQSGLCSCRDWSLWGALRVSLSPGGRWPWACSAAWLLPPRVMLCIIMAPASRCWATCFLAQEQSTFWSHVLCRVTPGLSLVIALYLRFFPHWWRVPSTSLIKDLCWAIRMPGTPSGRRAVFPI